MGFASSLLVGAVAGNTATTVIYRSLVGMLVCYFVGSVVAYVGRRAVQHSIEQYKRAHPIADGSANAEGDEIIDFDPTVGKIDQNSHSVDTSRSAA